MLADITMGTEHMTIHPEDVLPELPFHDDSEYLHGLYCSLLEQGPKQIVYHMTSMVKYSIQWSVVCIRGQLRQSAL